MRGVVLAGLLLAASCTKREALPQRIVEGPARSVVLMVAADLRGYLAPCGCSQNMRGGIARAAQQVSEARKAGPPLLFVEAGNSLFGKPSLPPESIPQEERKASALAGVLRLMGVATKVVGEVDQARPEALRRSLTLPEQPLGTVRKLEAGGQQIAVAAAADGKTLLRLCEEARAGQAAFVLGVLHQPLEEAQRVAALPGLEADLVLTVSSRGELDAEDNRLVRTPVPVAQLQSKGRSLLRLDLAFEGPRLARFELVRSQAELDRELTALDTRIELVRQQVNELGMGEEMRALRKAKLEELAQRRLSLSAAPATVPDGVNSLAVRFVPLEANLPASPGATQWVAAYDLEVGKLNLEWAKTYGQDCPGPTKGAPAFVGNEACRSCHEEAFPAYEASRHSSAFASLEKVGKNLHLDCVKCHVTGADKPGGVCRLDRLEGRKNVGCESCHGPGSLHREEPSTDNVIPVGPAVCQACHDRENSPHFEFERFSQEILGPGHGMPLPKPAQRKP